MGINFQHPKIGVFRGKFFRNSMNQLRNISALVSVLLFTVTGLLHCQLPEGSVLWLRADSGITDSAGRVILWRAKNDSLLVCSQFNPINRPYIIRKGMHGQPTIRFSGAALFFDGPAVFPVGRDYTITYVIRINSFASANNMVGGKGHSIFYSPPLVHHGDFYRIAQSVTPIVLLEPTIVTVVYRQTTASAQIFINGIPSGKETQIGENRDPSLEIGSYQHDNYLIGDISEIVIYDRICTEAEQGKLVEYMLEKYQIPRPITAALSPEIWKEIPQDLQLYPRNVQDSAAVKISGVLRTPNVDTICVKILKNKRLWKQVFLPLTYSQSAAPFEYTAMIHAELSEYTFEIYARTRSVDSLLTIRRDIVCGDVIAVSGQSNSIQGTLQSTYRNKFCRTFGINASQNPGDTLWAYSTALTAGGGTSVGAWGLRLQQLLLEYSHIPICLINGGKGSTTILELSPNENNPADISTLYGSMLYRFRKSGLQNAVKTLVWYQGESNIDTYYLDAFQNLYDQWKADYPSLQKIYVAQIRPGCEAGGDQGKLREVQRVFPTQFSDIEVIATTALPGHEECHFSVFGYHAFAAIVFRLIARDFYASTDTVAISSPNISRAFFTDTTATELALVFSPHGTKLQIQDEVPYRSVTGTMYDCFRTTNSDSIVNVQCSNDTVFIRFAARSTALALTYLPGTYYEGTTVTYEGPWIVNQRGIGALTFYNFPISKKVSGGIVSGETTSSPDITITPNPSPGECTVEFTTLAEGVVTISLYSLSGEEVVLLQNGALKPGNHTMYVSKEGIPSGTYILRIQEVGGIQSEKIIIIR